MDRYTAPNIGVQSSCLIKQQIGFFDTVPPFTIWLLMQLTEEASAWFGKFIYNEDIEIPNQADASSVNRSEEHTSELQSRFDLVCRLLLEKKNSGEQVYIF